VAVTLRFHGRFMYTLKKETGHLTVIAPTFPSEGPNKFAEHEMLMAIPLSQVMFFATEEDKKLKRSRTTLQPKHRVASHEDAENPQIVVWDIGGRHVSYDAPGGLTLPKDDKSNVTLNVLELVKLEAIRNPSAVVRLDGNALNLADSRTNSLFDVSSGVCTAVGENAGINLVSRAQAKAGRGVTLVPDPADKSQTAEFSAAELLTVDVTPHKNDDGDFDYLTLQFVAGQEKKTVTVKDGATVAFSNLCAEFVPPENTDLEFGRYYDLLSDPPGDDRLLPHDGTGASEGACCVCAAQA
jgi:hypothetical protein